MADLKASRGPSPAILRKHRATIDGWGIQRVLYTIQQSYGMACDVLVKENTAKKHVGLKFEALIGEVFRALGIAHKHLVFKYLRPLNGVYFIDPPPHVNKAAWKPYVKQFQDLVVADVWELLKPTG